MKEVILNDECAHCKDKECHDGYNFCNQAMKKNSFYKNAKLYKGLEVIQRPTYEDLEKENAELKAKNKWYSEQVCNKECAEVWGQLTKAKELLKEFVFLLHNPRTALDTKTVMDEAEQFLSEVEKC